MTGTLTNVIQRIMQKCKVRENTRVAIISSYTCDQDYVRSFVEAASNLEADAVSLATAPREKNGKLMGAGLTSEYLKETVKKAEIVFDIVAPDAPWTIPLYTPPFNELLASGARMLTFMVPNPHLNLVRLFPTDGLYKRSWKGAEMMAKAKTIRITSKSGTNLTMSKEGRKGHKQVGLADYPGMWDNYGFGLVACAPIEETVEGTFVISPGDYILGLGIDCIDPVKLVFKRGMIREVIGDGWSATLVRKWIEQNDEGAKRVSHIGWGTHENAVWRDSTSWAGAADAESYYGVMQLALGSNLFDTPHEFSGLGGKNKSAVHCDIDCLGHDFYLDETVICKEGKIVNQELK